jgi:PAS domain S-box-containing protein
MSPTTVKVSKEMEPLFAKAEAVVSEYFRQRKDAPSQGTIEVFGQRYVLVRGAALSVEFFCLVRELFGKGREAEAEDFARNMLFDLAHAVGKSDARNFHAKMNLSDPIERLSAGPIHFSHTGWAFVDISPESRPSPDENYFLLYDHPQSFEADTWIQSGLKPDFPVCIMNAGYSSGWCEESFGVRLVATEILCRAKGDPCCRFIMAPPDRIEEHVARYLKEVPHFAKTMSAHTIPDFFSRKRLEEDLRLNKLTLNAVQDGVYVFDLNGKFILWNRPLTRITGYSDEEISSLGPADFFAPEDVPRVSEAIARVLKDGSATLEADVVTKEGRRIPYELTGSLLRDSEGNLIGIAGTARDLTERKRAEEALRESNENLMELNSRLDATATEIKELMSTVVHDNAFGVRYSNPLLARCWEVKGCGFQACPAYGRADDLRCWEIAGTLCKGEVQGKFAHKIRDCGLCEVYRRAKATSVADLGETFNTMISILEDRHRALEEARVAAEAASRTKSEFLANMSHEIRTPMTAILGFAESLLDPELSESERLSAVYTIRRNGEHLLGLINDILDLSKIEAGRMTVERVPCSAFQIIAEVASLAKASAGAKNLLFDVECVGLMPETISTDPIRLHQILINLIGNAIKFTETGGVRLVARFVDGEEPMMQFDVLDTGIGMSPEQVARLFQPFVQGDSTITRKFGGTGLGLAISKRLATMLGGTIKVAHSEVGQGTGVRVTISTGPVDGVKMVDDPKSATLALPEHLSTARTPMGRLDCRVLLAEDCLDNQRLITHVLRRAGAEVTIAENGQVAVEKSLMARDEGRPFDVILMDMQMPLLDGYQAASLLRQKGYRGPIIALTANAMAGDRDKCINAGCDDYVGKPIDRRKLAEIILTHLRKPSPCRT